MKGKAAMASLVLIGLAACTDRDGPAEELGERIDDAAEEAGDRIENAADEVEEAAEAVDDALRDD